MNIEVNEQEFNLILAGLGKLPLEVSAQIFNKLQQQERKIKEDNESRKED